MGDANSYIRKMVGTVHKHKNTTTNNMMRRDVYRHASGIIRRAPCNQMNNKDAAAINIVAINGTYNTIDTVGNPV